LEFASVSGGAEIIGSSKGSKSMIKASATVLVAIITAFALVGCGSNSSATGLTPAEAKSVQSKQEAAARQRVLPAAQPANNSSAPPPGAAEHGR